MVPDCPGNSWMLVAHRSLSCSYTQCAAVTATYRLTRDAEHMYAVVPKVMVIFRMADWGNGVVCSVSTTGVAAVRRLEAVAPDARAPAPAPVPSRHSSRKGLKPGENMSSSG